MKNLDELKWLHDMGLALHWLYPKSKRPIGNNWQTGPRKNWAKILGESKDNKNLNIGVRTGEPSKLKDGTFLHILDIDIKSASDEHWKQAQGFVSQLIGKVAYTKAPKVKSGRGGHSCHIYIRTKNPHASFNLFKSSEKCKVLMPSVAAGKSEKELSKSDVHSGFRVRQAFEIDLLGTGKQAVIPPSIHPDSGRAYKWAPPIGEVEDIPLVSGDKFKNLGAEKKSKLEKIERIDVDISKLKLPKEIYGLIVDGDGLDNFSDRSAALYSVMGKLVRCRISDSQIVSLLTDPAYLINEKALEKPNPEGWIAGQLSKVKFQYSPEKDFGSEEVDLSDTDWEGEPDTEADPEAWRGMLDKTDKGGIKQSLKNVVKILENSVAPDFIKRDVFAVRDTFNCDTPWNGKKNENVNDDDIPMIKMYLSKKFGMEPKNGVLSEALTFVARSNAFHPVRDWLDALPSWDGVNRLDNWLSENFEAEGDPEYLAQVFKFWVTAMIMRIYSPGAKFDWMPIFEGDQDMGKSSFGKILCGGEKYFLDWLPKLADKEAALSLQGMWCIEMGELADLRKNEIETVKSFITRTVDKVRPPYGKRSVENPRGCVFFGTTNKEQYLRDDSGNRRFKPVKVGRLNFKRLKKDRLQLFAEAKEYYKTLRGRARLLELTGGAKDYEKRIQKTKTVLDDSDAMMEVFKLFLKQQKLDKNGSDFNDQKFSISELFGEVGVLRKFRYDNRGMQFAAKMIKKMGGEKRVIQGHSYWRLPKTSKTPHLSPPPPTLKKAPISEREFV